MSSLVRPSDLVDNVLCLVMAQGCVVVPDVLEVVSSAVVSLSHYRKSKSAMKALIHLIVVELTCRRVMGEVDVAVIAIMLRHGLAWSWLGF